MLNIDNIVHKNTSAIASMLLIILALAMIFSSDAHASGLSVAPYGVSATMKLRNPEPAPAPAVVPGGVIPGGVIPGSTPSGFSTIKIANLDVAVWNPVASGKIPLVIFSHGFNGCNTQSTFLTKAMMDAGYLVLAPNHKDAKCGSTVYISPEESFKNPEAWTDKTYVDRKDDIQKLLVELKVDSKWNARIDWNKVALSGHSLGGYTVLGLGGAWASWKTGGIKAILALSPVCSPYISAPGGNLGAINAAIMYQGGTKDLGVTPYIKKPGGCYDKSPSSTYFVEFNGAGHYAFTNAVETYQKDINYYSIAFLNAYVKKDPAAFKALQKRQPSVSDYKAK